MSKSEQMQGMAYSADGLPTIDNGRAEQAGVWISLDTVTYWTGGK